MTQTAVNIGEKIIELRENYNLKCKQFGIVLKTISGHLGGYCEKKKVTHNNFRFFN